MKGGRERQIEVYKKLKVLMYELDVRTFEIMSKHIEDLYTHESTKSFAMYFQKFINEPSTWAYCHRVNAGINTNMSLEVMHRNLKHLYLKGKKVKRLDKGIHAIMKFTRDYMYKQLIQISKGKLSRKLSDLRFRHKSSTKIHDNMVQKVNDKE